MTLAASVALCSVAIPRAEAQFAKPSKKQQIELGTRAAADVRRKERVLSENDERVQVLRRVGRRLVDELRGGDRDWNYTFDVIDSRDLNAFALPGGPVFFYTGLLGKLRTEDELAGVLAHEIAHVRREHWANAYREAQNRNLLLNGLLMVFGANRTTSEIANLGSEIIVGLRFSRSHETDADERGMDHMINAGYNPMGMADVFRILSQNSGSKPPEFLSTHPSDRNRIRRLEERARKAGSNFAPQRPLPWNRTQGLAGQLVAEITPPSTWFCRHCNANIEL